MPERTVAALRERAQRHGRSMQQELLEILRTAAAEAGPVEDVTPIDLVTVNTSASSTWRREEIYGDEGR